MKRLCERLVLTLLLGVVTQLVGWAQEEPAEQGFGEDLVVTEVLLDILVTDRDDRVVLGLGIEDFEVLDLLAQLVDKSLVQVDLSEAESRYRLLETVRQYAEAHLIEQGETGRWRDAHPPRPDPLAVPADPGPARSITHGADLQREPRHPFRRQPESVSGVRAWVYLLFRPPDARLYGAVTGHRF